MSVVVVITDGPLPPASQRGAPMPSTNEADTKTIKAHTEKRPKRKRGLVRHNEGDRPSDGQTGAVLVFEGIVRAEENGQRIDALMYTAYEPMATMELTRLARDVLEKHGSGLAGG